MEFLSVTQKRMSLLVLAASSLALPLASQAQDEPSKQLAPVQINSTSNMLNSRVDVTRTCPSYGEALRDSLVRSIHTVYDAGEMRVRFKLVGNKVETVETRGGPMSYRTPVRRAVRTFECVNDGQPNQTFNFLVVFKPDDSGDTAMAVNVVAPTQALAMNDDW